MDSFKMLGLEDYDEIKSLCKNIWDGNDYLPDLFHKWVNDKKGCFLSILHDNQIVALGKYSILLDNQGWLEGLRVHPNYRGLGFANKISDKLLSIAKEDLINKKIPSIGMCTHLDTPASINMMENRGFKLEQSCMMIFKENSKKNTLRDNFDVKEWSISYDDLINLDYFKNFNNRIVYGFTYLNLSESVYNSLIESKSLLEINGHKGIIKFKGKDISIICVDENIDGINTFYNYCSQNYDTDNIEIYITNPTQELISNLKIHNYISLSEYKKDCVYYLYK